MSSAESEYVQANIISILSKIEITQESITSSSSLFLRIARKTPSLVNNLVQDWTTVFSNHINANPVTLPPPSLLPFLLLPLHSSLFTPPSFLFPSFHPPFSILSTPLTYLTYSAFFFLLFSFISYSSFFASSPPIFPLSISNPIHNNRILLRFLIIRLTQVQICTVCKPFYFWQTT